MRHGCSEQFDPEDEGFECPECGYMYPQAALNEPAVADQEGSSNPSRSMSTSRSPDSDTSAKSNRTSSSGMGSFPKKGPSSASDATPRSDTVSEGGATPSGAADRSRSGPRSSQSGGMSDRSDRINQSDIGGGPTVMLAIGEQEFVVVKDGTVVTDSDGFGTQARVAAYQNGTSSEEAQKIHRNYLAFDSRDGEITVRNVGGDNEHGSNPTQYNDEDFRRGEQRVVGDGDRIELAGVITAVVRVEH